MIEDKEFLTDKQKEVINNTILGRSFPFCYTHAGLSENNIGYMSHIVLKRPERRNTNDDGIKSDYYDFFKSILLTFCEKHKININKFLRININLIFLKRVPIY